MALSPTKKQEMFASIVSICAEFEKLGLSIVDQYDNGNLDGRTAGTTHDLLLEGMATLVEIQTAIESGFEPGPESKELGGVLLLERPEPLVSFQDQRDLMRLYNDAPTASEPPRRPPIRIEDMPPLDNVTYDSPNN